MTEGMHTIPVPSMEIKHEFSGYFSDPFSKLRQRFDRERGVSFKTEKQTFGVMISLDLALYYGYDAQKVLETAQQKVGNAVEEFTSITMNGVNVRANRLMHLPKT